MTMKYSYQAEKLSVARSCLMLPHTLGIEVSIADAFRNCGLAFYRLDESGLDDNARSWVAKIKECMDTSGVAEAPEGTHIVKARMLTENQLMGLSRAVDELAHWFDRHGGD
jgi:hypothetical protein